MFTFFKQKYYKSNQMITCFMDYASLYNVEILNTFNSELQFKDTESSVKNKLFHLLIKRP